MYAILSLLFLILSAVFALKAKIGVTDEKKLEDFKPTLATPFRTILVWGISVEMLSLFVFEGFSKVVVLWGFVLGVWLLFWYIHLAEKILNREEYDHEEYNKFTATFSKRQWKFLFLFTISTMVSFTFYDKAFQIAEGKMFSAMFIWFPMLLFILSSKQPLSTKALRFLFFCITCAVCAILA